MARSGDVDWVDPLIGARVRHQLAPGQELLVRADIGGFGAGSEFSWNALAAYSFELAVRDGVTYSGLLGYRASTSTTSRAPAAASTNTTCCSMAPLWG